MMNPARTLVSVMSRTLQILVAGVVAVVFASSALASPASAEGATASGPAQGTTVENRQLDPETARPGGGADPFQTGMVIALNTALLGALVGGVIWGRRRLGCADVSFTRLSV